MALPNIPNYLVVEKLGSGSYSTVYKCFNKDGKRACAAVKCIEQKIMKGSAVENLITEIRLLKSLNHPHIVKMKDFQWDDKCVYIIMEYCNAGDLSKYLKQKVVPECLCKKLLRQLASALQELRARGIVHMDLKPQNLLLHKIDGEFVLKVGDFGFAQYMMDDETKSSSLRGSPLYMAPEVFLSCATNSSTPGYDAKVDLWSVGVILYECLFGKAPYSSNSYKLLEEKIRTHQKIEIPTNFKISADCRDLLENLLKHDPSQRIDYSQFFQHPFLDMKYIPSEENYLKAVELIREAVEKDSQQQFEEAYHLYCESLRYFVPMVTEEINPQKKSQLRNKVTHYIRRAEALKLFTISSAGSSRSKDVGQNNANASKQDDPAGPRIDAGTTECGEVSVEESPSFVNRGESNRPTDDSTVRVEELSLENELLKTQMARSKLKFDKLYSMCLSSNNIRTGLEVGLSAEIYVRESRLEEALKLYRGALNTLFKSCQDEPPGERRTLLVDKMDEWLREAESIKSLLESQKMQNAEDAPTTSCTLQ